LNLKGVVSQVDPNSVRLLSPDNVSKQLTNLSVRGTDVTFTIPRLEIYDLVVID
jgi:hypothetical protein